MAKFIATCDNAFAPYLVNIYRDGEHWAVGQKLDNNVVRYPVLNRNGEWMDTVARDLPECNANLNKYQGFTKRANRTDMAYIGV